MRAVETAVLDPRSLMIGVVDANPRIAREQSGASNAGPRKRVNPSDLGHVESKAAMVGQRLCAQHAYGGLLGVFVTDGTISIRGGANSLRALKHDGHVARRVLWERGGRPILAERLNLLVRSPMGHYLVL